MPQKRVNTGRHGGGGAKSSADARPGKARPVTPQPAASNGDATEKDADEKIAGGRLIPFLLYLVIHVLAKLNYKLCFWLLLLAVSIFVSVGSAMLVFVGAFFTLVASYRRSHNPFPACTGKLDVLFGRSRTVSTPTPEHLHANNNVSICTFRGKYVVAYRKSDIHFPSSASHLIIATSTDLVTWEESWDYHTGNDLREMLLFEVGDKLLMYFFALIPKNRIFKPIHVYCTTSQDARVWSEPEQVCRDREVPWDIKVYREADGRQVAYKASYVGDHYGTDDVHVLFESSTDGRAWKPVGEDAVVYRGGVCEVAFEFTRRGDLVAIGRNEDGDASGFGSQLFFARKESLGTWTHLRVSIPWRFDSPRMMRTDTGGDILLFARHAAARYDLTPPWLPFGYQKALNLIMYSALPKSAAVFRITPPEEWDNLGASAVEDSPFEGGPDGIKAVQFIRFFEQAFGDTGFFSVARDLNGGTDEWVVANYSASCQSHAPWIYGQLSRTDVHICRCRVVQ